MTDYDMDQALWDLGRCVRAEPTQPRTWTIPAEPYVAALTDRDGRTWKRQARGWVCLDRILNINAVETWAVLFTTRFPLTEVTP